MDPEENDVTGAIDTREAAPAAAPAPAAEAPAIDTGDDNSGVPLPAQPGMPPVAGSELDAAPARGGGGQMPGSQWAPHNVLRRLASWVTGAGAMPLDELNRTAAGVDPEGKMDASDRNILAFSKIAGEGGPQAAVAALQGQRTAYNAKQSFARAAFDGTQEKPADLNAALDAANQAATHVLDGEKVNFAAGRNGITATVTDPGGRPKQFNLTPDQFRSYLNVGKEGLYDRVVERKVSGTLAALTQGNAPANGSPLNNITAGAKRLPQAPQAPQAPAQRSLPVAGSKDALTMGDEFRHAGLNGKPREGGMSPDGSEPRIPGTHDAKGHYLGPQPTDKTGYSAREQARADAKFGPGDNFAQRGARQDWLAAQENQDLERENKIGVAAEKGKNELKRAQAQGAARVAATDIATKGKSADTAVKAASWRYASDTKKAMEEIKNDRQAARDGNIDARARLENGRKAIAAKRQTATALTKDEEALEAALATGGLSAANRANTAPAAAPAAAPQSPGAAPVPGARFFKGQWYTRGANGEAVPYQR